MWLPLSCSLWKISHLYKPHGDKGVSPYIYTPHGDVRLHPYNLFVDLFFIVMIYRRAVFICFPLSQPVCNRKEKLSYTHVQTRAAWTTMQIYAFTVTGYFTLQAEWMTPWTQLRLEREHSRGGVLACQMHIIAFTIHECKSWSPLSLCSYIRASPVASPKASPKGI
jgi:hypothetical protein